MADKKPPQRLGGLNPGGPSGDGKRLGTLKTGGAGASTSKPGAGSGFAARFKPKNFQKVEATAPSQDAQPSSSAPARDAGGRGRGRGRGAGRGPRQPATYHSEVVFGGVVGAGGAIKDPGGPSRAPGGAGAGAGASRPKDEPASPPRARRLVKAGELEAKEEREKRERPPKRTGAAALTDSDSDSSTSSSSDSASDFEDEYAGERPPMMLAPLSSEVAGPGQARRLRDALRKAGQDGGGAPSAVPTELMDRPPESRAALNAELTWLTDRDATEPGLMLFQLPSVLPIPAAATGAAAAGAAAAAAAAAAGNGGAGPSVVPAVEGRPAALSELPPERIGKLLVMRDGSVAAQIGDVLFEVSPGIPCKMHQEFAVVDPVSKEVTVLGELARRVVVTPDLGSLLAGEAPPLRRAAADGGPQGQRGFVVDLDSDEEGGEGKKGVAANGGAAAMEVEAT